MDDKLEQLKQILRQMERVAVAYSGGVDSTLVLKVAHDCLGEGAVALTAISASMPGEERLAAAALAQQIGVRQVMLKSHETDDPRYLNNAPDRCYFCKSNVYDHLLEYAAREGYHYVVDGTNSDDAHDHRPGRQAARERGVRSPLQEAGLTKAEIRAWARQLGLPNWDKPAAACLSSRVPYGTPITLSLLSQVEQAEAILKGMGLHQLRVRHHGPVARLEVEPEEFPVILSHRAELVSRLQAVGYTYITLDLAGFRSGSLNEALTPHGRGQTSPVAA